MRGGKTRTYPSFPDIEETVGYNPARFLDQPVAANPPIGETSPFATTWAVIQGLMEVETIRQWCNVEAALGRGRNGGPRKRVIKRLNERKIQIENGAADHEPAVEDTGTPNTSPSESEDSATVDGETASDDAAAESPTQSSPTAATTSNATAVATDGGEAVSDPTCSECGDELDREEIAGKIGHWCHTCRDFREPATTDSAVEPPSTPRCPDCRAELTPEDVGDETAFWCSYCGGFREPLDEAGTVEAVA